ncbi:MAG: hypothetical protein BYD32DRAFT_163103 [Podila humilis]|nr:MAG: hypothetical protein BYD32DRAFT_163103 [Podila humilis]
MCVFVHNPFPFLFFLFAISISFFSPKSRQQGSIFSTCLSSQSIHLLIHSFILSSVSCLVVSSRNIIRKQKVHQPHYFPAHRPVVGLLSIDLSFRLSTPRYF